MPKKKKPSSRGGRKKSANKKKATKSSPEEIKKRAAYRRAKAKEKPEFERLLSRLCDTIIQPQRKPKGRNPLLLRDIVYCMLYQVYIVWPSERASSTFGYLLEKGYISKAIKARTVLLYFNKESIKLVLESLLAVTAKVLALVDTVYLIDASHFILTDFLPYRHRFPDAYTVQKAGGKKWILLHHISGSDTKIIMAAMPGSMTKPERDFFQPLLKKTLEVRAEAARINYPGLPEEAEQQVKEKLAGGKIEIHGDKGYFGRRVAGEAEDLGVTPIITQKTKSRKKKQQMEPTKDKNWVRNSIESVNGTIKAHFGAELRNHNQQAIYNEVLCKAICHNLRFLLYYHERTGQPIEFK